MSKCPINVQLYHVYEQLTALTNKQKDPGPETLSKTVLRVPGILSLVTTWDLDFGTIGLETGPETGLDKNVS
jgi:hypothetical protein